MGAMDDITLTTPPSELIGYALATGRLEVGPEIDWDPEHLALSAWLEHVPFAFWIMKALRPRCLVELGTERGVSYSAFCQAVQRLNLESRCYAVDTWRGDDHSGHYDELVFASVAELNDRAYRQFSSLLRMTFNDALPYFADGEIDLLHIDGLHTYEAVAGDFATWRSKLSDRAVVLFHDTNVRRDDFGVWRLWRELQLQFPHFEFVHGYGLGVLGVGATLPPSIRALFEAGAQNDVKMAIRGLFAARGASVQRAYDLQSAREQTRTALNQTQQLSADMVSLRNEAAALQAQSATLHEENARAHEEVAGLRQQLALDDAAAAALRGELATSLAETASLREQLAAAFAEADALRARAGEADALRMQFAQEVAASRDAAARHDAVAKALVLAAQKPANDDTQNLIADVKARLAAAEARCEALLASTSWRISAPIRVMKTFADRLQVIPTTPKAMPGLAWATKRKGEPDAGKREPEPAQEAAGSPVINKRLRHLPAASQIDRLSVAC